MFQESYKFVGQTRFVQTVRGLTCANNKETVKKVDFDSKNKFPIELELSKDEISKSEIKW